LAQIEARSGDRRDAMEMFNRATLPPKLQKKVERIQKPPKPQNVSRINYCVEQQKRTIAHKAAIQRKVDLKEAKTQRKIDDKPSRGIRI